MLEEMRLLEKRVQELTAQVQQLTKRTDRISAHLGLAAGDRPEKPPDYEPPDELAEASEEIISWAGKKSLLPRVSTVSFLLVVALVLRTLTDSALIDKHVGSFLGMGYAALLIFLGWYKYGKSSPLAPVFAVCGAALMATIVLETHARFSSLPTLPAYAILMLTGIATAVIGNQFRVAVPVIVGTLGLAFAGAAIDYPYPFFPLLSILLLTANLLGTLATRIHRCSWLRWILLIITLYMLVLWATRLAVAVGRGDDIPYYLAQSWFLPVIAVFMVTFVVTALLGIIAGGQEKISKFDLSLPTINAVWTFTSARYVVSALGLSLVAHGVIGLAAAVGHLLVCLWLARKKTDRARGAGAFALAGSTLLILSLPLVLGSFLLSLPVLAITALGLSLASDKWQRGGIRLTSYLLGVYASGSLAMFLLPEISGGLGLTGGLVAAVVGVIAFYHYRWCRHNAPPQDSILFSKYDTKDIGASFLFLAALFAAFFALRTGIYQLIDHGTDGASNIFQGAQSVIINISVIGLIFAAYFRGSKEIRNIAALVTIIGACKVFFYDLLYIHGIPLVLSIFTFGLAAATESIILGRWPRSSLAQAKKEGLNDGRS
ncbi:MAG: hypothetical protein QMD32_06105 [Smithellaceae bacterium]|nr:hypothetical protein [Smithellaceae bacterium]